MNGILGTGKIDKMYTNFGIIRDLTIITLLNRKTSSKPQVNTPLNRIFFMDQLHIISVINSKGFDLFPSWFYSERPQSTFSGGSNPHSLSFG